MQPIQVISAESVIFIFFKSARKKTSASFGEPVSSVMSFQYNMHFILVNGAEHEIEINQATSQQVNQLLCEWLTPTVSQTRFSMCSF